ncbi:hypothetical protein BVG19_g1340 [[Candida] boidinii]|nr:hypothetical protein BVG19_g1340 [[Candida] boidinii]OWB49035.1 hypothetical protein B5S27_g574 [[Candida] boidinii]
MAESKYYARTKTADLRAELQRSDKKSKLLAHKKSVLKKAIANTTIGNNEMINLLPDVIKILQNDDKILDLELKKLCYNYLSIYIPYKPVESIDVIPVLKDDFYSNSTKLKVLSLRTISSIPAPIEFIDNTIFMIHDALEDDDPAVRKTAAYAIAKLFEKQPKRVQKERFLDSLNNLLHDESIFVVSAALSSLYDITEKSQSLKLKIDYQHALSLISHLDACNEWRQSYIITSLLSFAPQHEEEALTIIEKIMPYLQHSNSSVVLNTLKIIIYLNNYVGSLEDVIPVLPQRISSAISSLMSKPSEIQFLVMRNVILLLLSKSNLIDLDVSMFFCQYNDPIYIKDTKLEIIFLLANESNMKTVLRELEEYALDIDQQMVRKSIRAIGNLAIKIESTAIECVDILFNLLENQISDVVQETSIVAKDILRKYPTQFGFLVDELTQSAELIDEDDSKCSLIWIVGQYCDTIDNSTDLLSGWFKDYKNDPSEIQLTLLTAVMKNYLRDQSNKSAENLIIDLLKITTQEIDDPDLRDRGFFYWRLLSSQTNISNFARGVVDSSDMPSIDTENDKLPEDILEELQLNIGTLASIYLRPVTQVFRLAKPKKLVNTPALQKSSSSVESHKNNNNNSIYNNNSSNKLNNNNGGKVDNMLYREDSNENSIPGDLAKRSSWKLDDSQLSDSPKSEQNIFSNNHQNIDTNTGNSRLSMDPNASFGSNLPTDENRKLSMQILRQEDSFFKDIQTRKESNSMMHSLSSLTLKSSRKDEESKTPNLNSSNESIPSGNGKNNGNSSSRKLSVVGLARKASMSLGKRKNSVT